jgi:hypothetical protein
MMNIVLKWVMTPTSLTRDLYLPVSVHLTRHNVISLTIQFNFKICQQNWKTYLYMYIYNFTSIWAHGIVIGLHMRFYIAVCRP